MDIYGWFEHRNGALGILSLDGDWLWMTSHSLSRQYPLPLLYFKLGNVMTSDNFFIGKR